MTARNTRDGKTAPAGDEAFAAALRAQGLRVTPNRLRVFRTLSQHPEPLTATQLATILEPDGLNPTTIYRMLQQFTEAGLVHPVMVGHEAIGYELVTPYRRHHDHFLCVRCRRSFDLSDCGLDTALADLERRSGFHITFHHAELHGLCPRCQAELEATKAGGPPH